MSDSTRTAPGRPPERGWNPSTLRFAVLVLIYLVHRLERSGERRQLGRIQCGLRLFRERYLTLEEQDLALLEEDTRAALADLYEEHLGAPPDEALCEFVLDGFAGGFNKASYERLGRFLDSLRAREAHRRDYLMYEALYAALWWPLLPQVRRCGDPRKRRAREAWLEVWLADALLEPLPSLLARSPQAHEGCPQSLVLTVKTFLKQSAWPPKELQRPGEREVSLDQQREEGGPLPELPAQDTDPAQLLHALSAWMLMLHDSPADAAILLLDGWYRMGSEIVLNPTILARLRGEEIVRALAERLKVEPEVVRGAMEGPPQGVSGRAGRDHLALQLCPLTGPEDTAERAFQRWKSRWCAARKLLCSIYRSKHGEP